MLLDFSPRRLILPHDRDMPYHREGVWREPKRRKPFVRQYYFAGGNIGLLRGVWTQMMSTELNALGSGSGAVQATGTNAAFDNSLALGTGLMFWGDFEIQCTFASAPTAGKTVDLYLIPLSSTGGTTYSDGSATIQQPTLYVGSWVVRAINTLHILRLNRVPLPPDKFIVSVLNNADQALSASGHTVKFLGYQESYS